jgi:hypothetical protein
MQTACRRSMNCTLLPPDNARNAPNSLYTSQNVWICVRECPEYSRDIRTEIFAYAAEILFFGGRMGGLSQNLSIPVAKVAGICNTLNKAPGWQK